MWNYEYDIRIPVHDTFKDSNDVSVMISEINNNESRKYDGFLKNQLL